MDMTEMMNVHTADEKAQLVGEDIRDYVRDRFVPGSLSALDELRDKVAAEVWAAILVDRAQREALTPPLTTRS